MGKPVRHLPVQGKTENGAWSNRSFAVEQDTNGRGTDLAIGWAVAICARFCFLTTLRNEYYLAIFGERCILLGSINGICESLWRRFVMHYATEEYDFLRAVE